MEKDRSQPKPFYGKDKRQALSSSLVLSQAPRRAYLDLGMTLEEAFERLEKKGHLRPLEPRLKLVNKLRNWFPNHFCKFHQARGHQTNRCFRLKHEVQDLIDNGTIAPLK